MILLILLLAARAKQYFLIICWLLAIILAPFTPSARGLERQVRDFLDATGPEKPPA